VQACGEAVDQTLERPLRGQRNRALAVLGDQGLLDDAV